MADTFIDDLDWLPDELITSTKLNQWWANMQNFHNGTALGDGIIVTRHHADASIPISKIDLANFKNISRAYGYRTSNQTTTSNSPGVVLATNSPNANLAVTHTTKTGRVKIRLSLPIYNNANNSQVRIYDGTNFHEVINFASTNNSYKSGEVIVEGLTPDTSYTFTAYMNSQGGSTTTFAAFSTATLIVEDY